MSRLVLNADDFTTAVSKYSPSFARNILRFALNPVYSTKYTVHSEKVESPSPGSLLIANHQKFDDIPLIGQVWNRTQGRVPRFIMRSNLPSLYLKIGGIPVWRSSELRARAQTLGKAERASFIEDIRLCYEATWKYTTHRLLMGEDICLFPSGSRHSTTYRTDGIEGMATAYHNALGSPLSVIPLAINYCKRSPRSHVTIKVGTPIKCVNKQDASRAIASLAELVDQ